MGMGEGAPKQEKEKKTPTNQPLIQPTDPPSKITK